MKIIIVLWIVCGLLVPVASMAAVLGIAPIPPTELPSGTLATFSVQDEEVTTVAFNPSGRLLAAGSTEKTVRVYDWAAGKEVLPALQHDDEVNAVAFSPDGQHLASGAADGHVLLWDVASGRLLVNLPAHTAAVTGVAFSHAAPLIATGSIDGSVKIWDLATGKQTGNFQKDSEGVLSIAFSPDGKYLASAQSSGGVAIWSLEAQEQVKLLKDTDESTLHCVVFNADGTRVAAAGDAGTVQIWDMPSGDHLARLSGRYNGTSSLAFAPDNSVLVSASDISVVLWDVALGDEASTLGTHGDLVRSVAMSENGKVVASGGDDGQVRVWKVDSLAELSALQDMSDKMYGLLYDSARILGRRQSPLEKGVPLAALETVAQNAMKKVDQDRGSSTENLNSLVDTRQTTDFKMEDDPNYKASRRLRDQLVRNLLVMKAVADFAPQAKGSAVKKAQLVRTVVEKWQEVAEHFIQFYPTMANKKMGRVSDEKLIAWYHKLRFVARRNVLTAEELLNAVPSPEAMKMLSAEGAANVLILRARLCFFDADYRNALDVILALAAADITWADRMAAEAVKSFAWEPDLAGRSDRARDAARSLSAADFGAVMTGLAGNKDLTSHRGELAEAFAAFSTFHRPVSKASMLAVLAPLNERSASEMGAFVIEMLEMLKDVTTPTKSKDASKKIADADPAARVSEEYAAMDEVLTLWDGTPASWRGELLHAEIQYAWAKHQLDYVKTAEPEGEKGKGKGKVKDENAASSGDAEGYRHHIEKWKERISAAADGYLEDTKLEEEEKANAAAAVLAAWFRGLLDLRTEPAYPKPPGDDLLSGLRSWLGRLAVPVRELVLNDFAMAQLAALDPPPDTAEEEDDDRVPVKHEQRFDFVEAVASLAPDASASGVFKGILDDYNQLRSGVRLYVVPEGEIYESGTWVDGALPVFPVDSTEFGIWFTLLHTAEAKRASGGFRRYVRNSTTAVSADEYETLSETERTKYAEDFVNHLGRQLPEGFEIALVEPCTKPDVRRDFKRADGVWQESPLYYVVIRPTGNSPPQQLPPMQLDMDFSHSLGRVVLPLHSQPVPLRMVKGKVSHVSEPVIEQYLNDAAKDQGELVLTVTTESVGQLPPPHIFAGNLPPDGFTIDDSRTSSKLLVKSFPDGRMATAQVERTTTYFLDWSGGALSTTFRFPTYPALDARKQPWKVDSFMKRQGQIKERHVAHGEISLVGLPWRWETASRWLKQALTWTGMTVGLGLLIPLTLRIVRSQRRPPARPFPLVKPTARTHMAAASFLRRLAASPEIPLEESEVEALKGDVELLEGMALEPETGTAAGRDPDAIVDKWMQIARESFKAGLAANQG